jgi:YidC/Oxa1 family membrane protein insertase
MGFISRPFGILLFALNHLVGNYGWALVLFTTIVRILLLPLSIKQHRSMQETQRIQPKLAELQKKYANDKQKLNEETMKLYKEHNVNPMGGCLPLLIQFPIIIGLYQVIIRPLTYMLNISADKIAALTQQVNEALAAKGQAIINGARQSEIIIAQNLTPEMLKSIGLENVSLINFNFLGLNLGDTPSLGFTRINFELFGQLYSAPFITLSPLLLIPILAALTTFLSTKITTALSGSKPQEGSAASTMNTMNMLFPLMTAWFAFTLPAGVGLYWILGNIIQMIQQIAITKYFGAKQPEVEAQSEATSQIPKTPAKKKGGKPKKGGKKK